MTQDDVKAAVAHLPPLRELIREHGLGARRGLGQHFLLDLNLTRKIARAAGPLAERRILEIGPGPGGLTRALLLEGATDITAVERDTRIKEALAPLLDAAGGRLRLIEDDALKVNEAELCRPPITIVANLPYNISTPLLFKWFDRLDLFDGFVLMFQKEVAERILARPGSRTFGRLAVMSQWRCEVASLFDVPASAFTPPPKVVSSVLELRPRPRPLADAEPAVLEKVVAAAFGQRRKMLRASLRQLTDNSEVLLEEAGIEPTARPESLCVEEFCALARAAAALGIVPV
jgi:16S rRNA (adenine1518-N6/adenine1519-N6)-dimethyltransferase